MFSSKLPQPLWGRYYLNSYITEKETSGHWGLYNSPKDTGRGNTWDSNPKNLTPAQAVKHCVLPCPAVGCPGCWGLPFLSWAQSTMISICNSISSTVYESLQFVLRCLPSATLESPLWMFIEWGETLMRYRMSEHLRGTEWVKNKIGGEKKIKSVIWKKRWGDTRSNV